MNPLTDNLIFRLFLHDEPTQLAWRRLGREQAEFVARLVEENFAPDERTDVGVSAVRPELRRWIMRLAG